MLRIDARIPVRFGPADSARAEEVLLVEGVGFALGAHVPGCTCCGGRASAAVALLGLFQMRARGEVPFFRGVVAVVGAAGQAAVRDAVTGDALASGRFRMA